MASAGTVTVDFAAETAKFTAELKKIQGQLGQMQQSLNTLDKAARIAFRFFTAGAILSFAKSAFIAADATADMAESAGLAVETFSRLQFAAGQTDVQINSLASGISKYQVLLSKANSENREAQVTLARYNLEGENLSKLSLDEQLIQLSKEFGNLSASEDRTRFATDLFGRAAGPELSRFLGKGEEGIRKLFETADRLGITLRGPTAEAIGEVDAAIKRVTASAKAAVSGALGEFALLFSPPSTQEGKLLVEIARIEGFIRDTKDVLAGGRGLRIFVDEEAQTKRLVDLNAQLAVMKEQLAGIRGETAASKLNDLLPLPFLDPLQTIDIAAIQELKINVDELGAAFQRLNLSIAEIQQARSTEVLELVNDAVLESQRQVERLATAEFQVGLDQRSAAAHAHRAFELQQEQALQQSLQSLRSGTVNAAIGALQAFAGHSKKAAIALVLINKARAIASVIQDTAAAAVKAIAVYGPTPAGFAAAGAAKAFGAAQIALIAAAGFGEIQAINRSGGAPLGSPSNPINTQSQLSDAQQFGAAPQAVTQVIIANNVGFDQRVLDQIIDGIKDAVDERDVIIFGPESRQAKELVLVDG